MRELFKEWPPRRVIGENYLSEAQARMLRAAEDGGGRDCCEGSWIGAMSRALMRRKGSRE